MTKSETRDRVLELPALQGLRICASNCRRDPRLLQREFRGLREVLARDLESRDAVDRLDHIVLADPVAQVVRALRQQQVAHHRLEHLILQYRLLLRRDVAAEALLQLALLALPGLPASSTLISSPSALAA